MAQEGNMPRKEDNLQPYRKNEQRAKANGRKGGLASGHRRLYKAWLKQKFIVMFAYNDLSTYYDSIKNTTIGAKRAAALKTKAHTYKIERNRLAKIERKLEAKSAELNQIPV